MNHSCSLSLLLWTSKLAQSPCDGIHEKIGGLNSNLNNILVRNKCAGSDETSVSAAELLLNRLSPYSIKQESVASLDVCRAHLVSSFCTKKKFVDEKIPRF